MLPSKTAIGDDGDKTAAFSIDELKRSQFWRYAGLFGVESGGSAANVWLRESCGLTLI